MQKKNPVNKFHFQGLGNTSFLTLDFFTWVKIKFVLNVKFVYMFSKLLPVDYLH